MESVQQFEERKRDHLTLAMKIENEARGSSGLDSIELIHEALPDLNFSEIEIKTQILGRSMATPFLVSSMTAGHNSSVNLNIRLAQACANRGWLMGVGSQRRELSDPEARREWEDVRKQAPEVSLLGNLGLSQLIQTSVDQIRALTDALEAVAMIVHLNPLQESLQPEGTPQFRGGWKKLAELVKGLPIPVVVKETGCGFSKRTLQALKEVGVAAVDVSGFGGTHWGRIEGQRSHEQSVQAQVAETFANWGVSTLDSLMNAIEVQPPYEIWASGGIRTGLDGARTLALGATCVGLAKPILQAALVDEESLYKKMEVMETELKTAMFCTGCRSLGELKDKKVWAWRQKK